MGNLSIPSILIGAIVGLILGVIVFSIVDSIKMHAHKSHNRKTKSH